MAVPIIDISPFVDEGAHSDEERAQVSSAWDRAMTEVGFAIIQGHGVAPEVVGALRSGAMNFFSEDAATKNAYHFGPYGNPLGGYTGMGTESVNRTRSVAEYGSDGGAADEAKAKAAEADLVESYIFKPEEATKPKPPALTEAGAAYHAELLRVLGCLHHVTAAVLENSVPACIPMRPRGSVTPALAQALVAVGDSLSWRQRLAGPTPVSAPHGGRYVSADSACRVPGARLYHQFKQTPGR